MANVYLTTDLNTLQIEPQLIETIQYVNDFSVQTLSKEGIVYLVAYGTYEEIRVRVENENYVGVSLFIKLSTETPDQYRKEIILNNVSGNPSIYEINYKWNAINHLIILRNTENICFLNVYVKRKI